MNEFTAKTQSTPRLVTVVARRSSRALRRFSEFLLFMSVLLLLSCRPHPAAVVIGSKNFTEQLVLGELLAQQIERSGLPVERRFYLAGTYICQQSLLAGRIDVYPEYTGTALTAVLKQAPASNPNEVYARVRDAYERQFHFAVLPPLGFNNSFALVIRGDDARRLNLATISDLSRVAPEFRMGVGYEFLERPDGYRGLVQTYGLRFREAPRQMDLGLLYRALQEKQVDVVVGNNTDGQIAAMHLVALADDRRYFPPYDAVVIARDDSLRRWPQLRAALQQLSGNVTVDEIRRMNYEVDVSHADATKVVADFLASKHLAPLSAAAR